MAMGSRGLFVWTLFCWEQRGWSVPNGGSLLFLYLVFFCVFLLLLGPVGLGWFLSFLFQNGSKGSLAFSLLLGQAF